MLLTYTNDKGQSISFTNKSNLAATSILLTDADGLHGLPAEVHVLSQYGQDGATYVDSQLAPRHVSLSGKIVRNVIATRQELLRVMHPKMQGTLTLTRGHFTKKLRCAIEEAPSFATKNGSLFTVALVAPNPYWLDSIATKKDLAVWEPMFEWPLDIPKTSGVSFGERTASLIANVYNPGEATIGMQVVIKATSPVINPAVSHVITYKTMRANLELQAGDVLIITTGYGEKQVTLQRAGQAQAINAMAYMDIADPDFEFLQLAPGDNILRYDAAAGAENMIISVYYAPGYLGV